MRLPILLCLAVLLSSPAAFAQECDRSDESQAGMNICANEDYKAADAKLNKTYSEIMKRLSDDADGRKLLQAAQRSWIAFRDAECNFSTADSQGGSIHPMLVSGCLQGLTEARTEQLGSYLNCEEGDMSCPVPAE
ncbi:MAG TPA: lysozyme inhibitor LprI family protein [Pseudaminobacter sp.]|nr:lysozyme inhibitor LprI family protein [Pseudaminobacter sp.]